MLNNLLKTIYYKDGFIHWCSQRISAFILLLSVIFFDVFTIFSLFVITASIHLYVGVGTLLDDYVHGTVEHLLGTTILRITIIFALKTFFILCI